MTLIITEFTPFGIAMVADSALTVEEEPKSGDSVTRVLNGLRKVQAIPHLSAGISMWGLGELPGAIRTISTDVWIFDFIRRHTDTKSIDEFANQLADELQEELSDIQEPLGFHLAGYVQQEGQGMPVFYHIRNVDGEYGDYQHHDFIPGYDPRPQQELAAEKGYRVRNGDYGPYAIVATAAEVALAEVKKRAKLRIPHPSLQGRIAYNVAWVRFVSDLYASSGMPRTIGGAVDSLGITPEGHLVY